MGVKVFALRYLLELTSENLSHNNANFIAVKAYLQQFTPGALSSVTCLFHTRQHATNGLLQLVFEQKPTLLGIFY